MIIRRKLQLEQCKVCRRPSKRVLIIDLIVAGFRMQTTPIALLQRWYSHIREKRPTRQDFLKSLVKIFQENPSYESSQDDVNYRRYMAENFAAFDYKTQEGGSNCHQIPDQRPFNNGNAIAGDCLAVPSADASPCAFAVATTAVSLTIPTTTPIAARIGPKCRNFGAAACTSTMFDLYFFNIFLSGRRRRCISAS